MRLHLVRAEPAPTGVSVEELTDAITHLPDVRHTRTIARSTRWLIAIYTETAAIGLLAGELVRVLDDVGTRLVRMVSLDLHEVFAGQPTVLHGSRPHLETTPRT